MNTFSPTLQDVERYRGLRAASVKLSNTMVETIPSQAIGEIGDALGLRRNGVLVFDSEDVSCVLIDCCLYDWYQDGKNLVQRYAETHAATAATDERYLLQAYPDAKYRILVVQSVVRDAGLHCLDLLNREELFVMDIASSQTLRRGSGLATRTIPLGEFWMTGGASLPIDRDTDIQAALRQTASGSPINVLAIVRACLDAGAAKRIGYAGPQSPPTPPRPRDPRPLRRRRKPTR